MNHGRIVQDVFDMLSTPPDSVIVILVDCRLQTAMRCSCTITCGCGSSNARLPPVQDAAGCDWPRQERQWVGCAIEDWR